MSHHTISPAVLVTVGVGAALVLSLAIKKLFSTGPPKALDSSKYIPLKLIERKEVSPDTRIFRFALPTPKHVLGLPNGQHMYVRATINGREEMRQYTPITSDEAVGYVDLLIKVYFANVHPKFPEGGKLSQHFEGLAIGSCIDVCGPKGRFHYVGRGAYTIGSDRKGTFRSIGMIAGGTGITPMLQVVRAMLRDRKDTTKVWLLFANQTEEDILLRGEIDSYAAQYPHRFTVNYTLDRPPATWKGFSGFVTDAMLQQSMPGPSEDTFIVMCGPPPMVNLACRPNLKKLGYSDERMFAF